MATVKAGVKAVFSSDKSTVTTYAYPSKSGYAYKLTKKTWKNKCPFCGKKLSFNPKKVPEGELTCSTKNGGCDADFCCVSGLDKAVKPRAKLTPATVTANSTTKVAASQTQSQYCSLSKAEALTEAKKGLNTQSTYKGSLKIPVLPGIKVGDLCEINIPTFPKGTYYIDTIKEDIDAQSYTLDLIKGSNHLTTKYEGSYILLNKNGSIINTNSTNPLQAKCSTVNTNIGLKASTSIAKKIMLKGQKLGTVEKIYKWLRITSGGGTGGWKYKKYDNHIVSSENVDTFGSKSATKCWSNKRANCCDFAWIMAMMGKGAGKGIGVKKGTYTNTSGVESGHMWNYYGTKYYDCSSNTNKTIDWLKVEDVV